MADSLAGALFNATLHKQSLIDTSQLLSAAVDVSFEVDPRQEFMDSLQEELLAKSKSQKNSQEAGDKLDELLSSFGSDNILSW